MKAFLLLEDGSVIQGAGFGVAKTVFGELVFNTGMTGYQENLTDPSYNGQILLMTYPLIGNYGCVPDTASYQWQSGRIQAEGFVVSEFCVHPEPQRSPDGIGALPRLTIDEFLKKQDISGISNVDTRELTMKIRKYGTIKTILAVVNDGETIDTDRLLNEARTRPSPDTTNLVAEVTTTAPVNESSDGAAHPVRSEQTPNNKSISVSNRPGVNASNGANLRIALIDCGVKRSIIRELLKRNCQVYRFPYNATAAAIESIKPDGILISNGPGDPAHPDIMKYTVKTVQGLINKYPVWGICLGHQILSLVLGAKTYKLKFGHRGVNQPVKNLKTNKLFITSQNHGFAVAAESCPADIEITELNINDGTVEAMRHKTLPVYSVQYHPEASPGPNDSNNFFDEFAAICQKRNTNNTNE